MPESTVLVVGGTEGRGREVATLQRGAANGRSSPAGTRKCRNRGAEIGEGVAGLDFDVGQPETIADGSGRHRSRVQLVLAAIDRDNNPVKSYTVADAVSSRR